MLGGPTNSIKFPSRICPDQEYSKGSPNDQSVRYASSLRSLFFANLGIVQQQRSSFMTPMYSSAMSMGQYGMGMNMPAMQYGMNISQGKGKAREVDFEAAFAHFADSQPQTSRIEEVGIDAQLDELVAEGMQNVKLDDTGKPLDYEG